MWTHRDPRRYDGGFTLIEMVVVLAILGILVALAMPRYLGSRRHALIPEARNTLQEMKTAAWGYYQQNNTWSGLTTGVPMSSSNEMGFIPPSGACWQFGILSAVDDQVVLRAVTFPAGGAKCGVLPVGGTIDLTITGEGTASFTENL